MPKLFGLEIDKIISDSISSSGGLRPVTVTRTAVATRDPSNITSGRQGSPTMTRTQGYVESVSEFQRENTTVHHEAVGLLIARGMSFEPSPGDTVEVDGRKWTIVGPARRDPAGASYEIMLR